MSAKGTMVVRLTPLIVIPKLGPNCGLTPEEIVERVALTKSGQRHAVVVGLDVDLTISNLPNQVGALKPGQLLLGPEDGEAAKLCTGGYQSTV